MVDNPDATPEAKHPPHWIVPAILVALAVGIIVAAVTPGSVAHHWLQIGHHDGPRVSELNK